MVRDENVLYQPQYIPVLVEAKNEIILQILLI